MDRLVHDREQTTRDNNAEIINRDLQAFMADCKAWQVELLEEFCQDPRTHSTAEGVDMFSNRLKGHIGKQGTDAFIRLVLRRLAFDELAFREDEVCSAHRKTFEWLYADGHDSARTMVDFKTWLQVDDTNNLFWVTGKAGSGKSTLMKLILQDPRTKSVMEDGDWARGQDLDVATFFFWNPGSILQKSREGLLRTLLYQILHKHQHLIPRVFEPRYQLYKLHDTRSAYRWDWTWTELRRAMETLLSDASRRYFILVDGLDELDGMLEKTKTKETQETIDFIVSTGRLHHVKLCISSRPWLVFEDAFGEKPSLTMEYLTRPDITLYIETRFGGSEHFSKLKKQDEKFASQLIANIADKALGVFLWVDLVVRSLLTGLSNSDRISDLQTRLDELPSELEALFGTIIASLEPFYQIHALQLFQIVEAYNELVTERVKSHQYLPLTLLALFFADNEDDTAGLNSPIGTLTLEQTNDMEESMRRRLNSRCRGLLEATAPNPEEDSIIVPSIHFLSRRAQHGSVVRYMHRTTRDYIRAPETWVKIVAKTGPSFDPYRSITNSMLMQLKILNIAKAHLGEFLTAISNCCYTISYAKVGGLNYTVRYLDEVDRAANVLLKEGLIQNQAVVAAHRRNSKAPNWINLYTAFPVVSLLDYAIGQPLDFENLGKLDTEGTQINNTLSKYAVAKIQTMAPLATDAAEWWLGKCDREEVSRAIKAACPGIEYKIKLPKKDKAKHLDRFLGWWGRVRALKK
jgi:ABC-type multidrug transport system fused ATPase/permease subunit